MIVLLLFYELERNSMIQRWSQSYSVIHLIFVMLWIFAFEIFDREFPLDLNNLMQNARISF